VSDAADRVAGLNQRTKHVAKDHANVGVGVRGVSGVERQNERRGDPWLSFQVLLFCRPALCGIRQLRL
jgi:hypothetical protein